MGTALFVMQRPARPCGGSSFLPCVLSLAALLLPALALANQAAGLRPDDGVRPGFHQKNAGKIVFSTQPIALGKENPARLGTSFKLGQPIYWRVYAERSGANQASKEGHECSFDREVPPARAFIVELDGQVLEKTYQTFMGTRISKKEWNTETSWSEAHGFNAPVDTHEISFNAGFVGRVVGDLTPGTHRLVIKAVVECDCERPRFTSQPMAEGSLTLEVRLPTWPPPRRHRPTCPPQRARIPGSPPRRSRS